MWQVCSVAVLLGHCIAKGFGVGQDLPNCPEATSSLVSRGGDDDVKVTFHAEDMDDDVQLFWVDYDGQEVLIHEVAQGASSGPHSTFIQHIWRARASDDARLLLEVEITAELVRHGVRIPRCSPRVLVQAKDPEEVAWLSENGWQGSLALSSCPLAALLSETRVRGWHLLCVVRELHRVHLCVFPDGLQGHSCAAAVSLRDGSLQQGARGIAKLVARRLGLKERAPHQPPMGLFTASGRRLDNEEQVLPPHRTALVLVEGGHWQWPPVRVGFSRPLGIFAQHGEEIELKTLSLRPRVFEILHFIRSEEGDRILEKASPHMRASYVSLKDTDRGKLADDWRTSVTHFLPSTADDLLLALDRRIQNITRMPITHAEHAQVLRYDYMGRYTAHHDFFDPHAYQKDERILEMTGNGVFNRQLTVFMYLSDVAEGGETGFPRAGGLPVPTDFGDCSVGIVSRPKRGKVILFYSTHPSGEADPLSLHGGCRVKNGTKWSANFWVWNKERPFKQGQAWDAMLEDLQYDPAVDRAEDRVVQALAGLPQIEDESAKPLEL